MSKSIIETRTAFVSWDERGFVRVKCKPGKSIDLEDAITFNQARKAVALEEKHLCLFDARHILDVSRGSRKLAADSESLEITRAFATIIGSPLGRVLGNFFIQVDKPPYPTKLFTGEDAAVEWLLQFKGKNEERK